MVGLVITHSIAALSVLSAACALILALAVIGGRPTTGRWRELLGVCQDLCSIPGSSHDSVQMATGMLRVISRIVPAGRYCLYLSCHRNPNNLALKAVLDERERVIDLHEPAGDPEVPHDRTGTMRPLPDVESRRPPAIIPAGDRPGLYASESASGGAPHSVANSVPGGGPGSASASTPISLPRARMLSFPLVDQGGLSIGAIRAWPVNDPRDLRIATTMLQDISPALCTVARAIAKRDVEERERRRKTVSVEGSSIAASYALSPRSTIAGFTGAAARSSGASAWLLYFRHRDSAERFHSGLREAEIERLVPWASRQAGPAVFTRDADAGDPLQQVMADGDYTMAYIVPLVSQGATFGGAVYLFKNTPRLEPRVTQLLSDVTAQVSRLVAHLPVCKGLQGQYLESLRVLVSGIEMRDRVSCGGSARVARYAREVALEMGLSPREVETISTAAFLRDVGMMALDSGIVSPGGRDPRPRREGHVILGKALVNPADESGLIGPMILHHHERYDGFGYPHGLEGDSIPIGARIIAVADAFNDRVSGTPHGAPIPFDKALEVINRISGSEIDPDAGAALVSVFRRKQENPDRWGKTLEPCWTMVQCPAHIRNACPAGTVDVRCWELPHTVCAQHGASHLSCMVFTEYHHRLLTQHRATCHRGRTAGRLNG